jgi:hypothetical protein
MAPRAKPINEKLCGYSVADNGCWQWNGYKLRHGYGAFKHKGKMLTAHRESYKLHKGEIPDGLCVCHTCDNRSCINPAHLWLGTTQDNTRDRTEKGRSAKGVRAAGAKLQEHDVYTIRGMAAYTPRKQIAGLYNLNLRTVFKILTKETWGHLP